MSHIIHGSFVIQISLLALTGGPLVNGLRRVWQCRTTGKVVQAFPHVLRKEWLKMATGKVKWFNDQKGFGFIAAEDNRDVFVHHSVIEGDGYKTLEDGENVEYEAEDGPKGLKALKVRRSVTAPA